jgi:protein-S-isoprenylcysteine O-methyltransferase Ste14
MTGPREARRQRVAGVVLALACLLLAAAHTVAAHRQRTIVLGTLLVVEDLLLAAGFMRRRPWRSCSRRPLDVVIAGLVLVLPLLLRPAPPGPLAWLAPPIQLAAACVAVAATFTLGRSLGVLPADRGVVVRGPYAAVRHPMYGAYLLAWSAQAAAAPSPANVVLVTTAVLLLDVRARREERLLEAEPRYRAYRERVPWTLLPGVW